MEYIDTICQSDNVTISNFLPEKRRGEYAESIMAGLTARKKQISSIFFYDETGSRLFEKITALPEYYLYNTEKKLLREIAPRICRSFEGIDIVEIGSGDCSKISILLEAIPASRRESVRYVPVDISYSAVRESADIISERFPRIEFNGLVADFLDQLHRIPAASGRFFCFFGSTLGNLSREQSLVYLMTLREEMSPGDNLLLGMDMVKDREIMERAYNDSSGITAEFNRNILRVANKLAGTDFNPGAFRHVAFYNEDLSRIEMHLEAGREMKIRSPRFEDSIFIAERERIHTENSHKFTREQLEVMVESAGLRIREFYTDSREWFSLLLIVRE